MYEHDKAEHISYWCVTKRPLTNNCNLKQHTSTEQTSDGSSLETCENSASENRRKTLEYNKRKREHAVGALPVLWRGALPNARGARSAGRCTPRSRRQQCFLTYTTCFLRDTKETRPGVIETDSERQKGKWIYSSGETLSSEVERGGKKKRKLQIWSKEIIAPEGE